VLISLIRNLILRDKPEKNSFVAVAKEEEEAKQGRAAGCSGHCNPFSGSGASASLPLQTLKGSAPCSPRTLDKEEI